MKQIRRNSCRGTVWLALVGMLAVTSASLAQDKKSTVREDARQAGRATGNAVREIGQGLRQAGKEIGSAAKEGGRELHRAVKGQK